jgi:hypothetical protein
MTKSQILTTRATLQAVVTNSTTPRAAKRAALLKLTELRRIEAKAATPPAAKKPLIQGRKTDDDARHFAFTKYKFLCAQRGALIRRWGRLSRDEFQLHQALTTHLPAEAPPVMRPHDTPEQIHDKCWHDFVGAIKATLTAVRDLPLQAN